MHFFAWVPSCSRRPISGRAGPGSGFFGFPFPMAHPLFPRFFSGLWVRRLWFLWRIPPTSKLGVVPFLMEFFFSPLVRVPFRPFWRVCGFPCSPFYFSIFFWSFLPNGFFFFKLMPSPSPFGGQTPRRSLRLLHFSPVITRFFLSLLPAISVKCHWAEVLAGFILPFFSYFLTVFLKFFFTSFYRGTFGRPAWPFPPPSRSPPYYPGVFFFPPIASFFSQVVFFFSLKSATCHPPPPHHQPFVSFKGFVFGGFGLRAKPL